MGKSRGGSGKKYLGGGLAPHHLGGNKQQRLSTITIEPITSTIEQSAF